MEFFWEIFKVFRTAFEDQQLSLYKILRLLELMSIHPILINAGTEHFELFAEQCIRLLDNIPSHNEVIQEALFPISAYESSTSSNRH